jgi:hypothetical protein
VMSCVACGCTTHHTHEKSEPPKVARIREKL